MSALPSGESITPCDAPQTFFIANDPDNFPRGPSWGIIRLMRVIWTLILLFLASPLTAHPGVGIVMDRKGNVYYTDLSQVWRITPSGQRSVVVPGVHTHELTLDTAGNLFGEHTWYEGDATKKWGHYVWRLSPDGNVSRVIPATEGFLQNYSFVRDGRGTMYLAEGDPRTVIRKRMADGRILSHAKGPFRNIRWMHATADGTLFLIDSGDLRRVAPDGTVKTVSPGLAAKSVAQFSVQDHHIVMGVWTDTRGNAYAAVYGGRVVKKITPGGAVSIAARSAPPWSPTGGLIAPDGSLWLLEYSIQNTARVRRIAPDGRVAHLVTAKAKSE